MAAMPAIVARLASGVRDFAMPRTAPATIATAAALTPASQPVPIASPKASMPKAKATSRIAEGIVNANHAASRPPYPARCRPIAMPTCEDAGPGRNWQRATRSA